MELTMKPKRLKRDESGQAVIEYVLLISIIVSAFVLISRGLVNLGFADKLTAPIKGEFARIYQYGHPKAKGHEDGGPEFHPRANGRVFINPRNR
jgi:Flp pilus assembly pilin Flp